MKTRPERQKLLQRLRPGPVARVALGLVAVTLGIVILADFAFSLLRDDVEVARQIRKRVSENVAVQLAVLAQKDDPDGIARVTASIQQREPDVLSIGVRRADERLMYSTAFHAQAWEKNDGAKSTLTHVKVPMLAGDRSTWGQVEIAFRPVEPQSGVEWLRHPMVMLVLALVILGYAGHYLYMRRVLQVLDPSTAIPDRVRVAFDTLAEGLVVLDVSGRILLANRAFRSLRTESEEQLAGRKISELPWVVAALGVEIVDHPWHRAVRSRMAVTGVLVEVTQVDGSATRRAVVNASPVLDAKGAVRGCLVSFNDVTDLDRVNAELRAAMDELQLSKARIEMQNEELRRLANIDPLTTCLNRRAFMAEADTLFAEARKGTPLACIMADIDKFKLVNDTYGHAVGDEVIIQVSRVFMLGLRPGDVLCRYGGEEFCILLPGLDLAQAAAVAERLREKVESQAGPGIRSIDGLRVTSSFGVSELSLGATTLPQLIEEADQALYSSKQAGRNFVSLFTETPWLSSAVDSAVTRANAGAALAMDEMVILEADPPAPGKVAAR